MLHFRMQTNFLNHHFESSGLGLLVNRRLHHTLGNVTATGRSFLYVFNLVADHQTDIDIHVREYPGNLGPLSDLLFQPFQEAAHEVKFTTLKATTDKFLVYGLDEVALALVVIN